MQADVMDDTYGWLLCRHSTKSELWFSCEAMLRPGFINDSLPNKPTQLTVVFLPFWQILRAPEHVPNRSR